MMLIVDGRDGAVIFSELLISFNQEERHRHGVNLKTMEMPESGPRNSKRRMIAQPEGLKRGSLKFQLLDFHKVM